MNASEWGFVRTVGTPYIKSSQHEDAVEHWDVDLHPYGKVDVKAVKSVRRGEKEQSKWNYVEFKNVHGNKGWLYGISDHIAFETYREFIIVPTYKLREWAEHEVIPIITDTPEPYHLYTRTKWGRKDLMMRVLNDDLRKLAIKILEKK